MKTSDHQWDFLQDVALLIHFSARLGYKLTGGQLHRPDELQKFYYRTGRSKTMTNRHGQRLAIDFNIFVGGKYLKKKEDRLKAKPLGDFWEGLRPENRWGGSWRGLVDSGKSNFIDIPHFERKI